MVSSRRKLEIIGCSTVGEPRLEGTTIDLKPSANALPAVYDLRPAEQQFSGIIGDQAQFNTRVLDGWYPPVDFEASWSQIEYRMIAANYTARGVEQF